MKEHIEVSIKNACDVGNCNGCTKHRTKLTSYAPSCVWEVSLRGISIRLCSACRDELIRKLIMADEDGRNFHQKKYDGETK